MVFKSSMIILFEVCLKGLKKVIYMTEVVTRESMCPSIRVCHACSTPSWIQLLSALTLFDTLQTFSTLPPEMIYQNSAWETKTASADLC